MDPYVDNSDVSNRRMYLDIRSVSDASNLFRIQGVMSGKLTIPFIFIRPSEGTWTTRQDHVMAFPPLFDGPPVT